MERAQYGQHESAKEILPGSVGDNLGLFSYLLKSVRINGHHFRCHFKEIV